MKKHNEIIKTTGTIALKITGIIVAAMILIAIIISLTIINLSPNNTETVNVQGQAEISIIPDLAVVYFNVQTNASTSQEAKDENARIVDDIITDLVKAGFNRDDISTENFNIYEDYDWTEDGREFKGYKATHSLKVKMSADDTQLIGDAIDAGVDNGALLNYINFELSPENQNKYKSEATVLAARNAKGKAEAMAEGLGMKLGKVISVSDVNLGFSPYRAYSASMDSNEGGIMLAEAKAVSTNIQPGEQKVYGNVNVVYRLK